MIPAPVQTSPRRSAMFVANDGRLISCNLYGASTVITSDLTAHMPTDADHAFSKGLLGIVPPTTTNTNVAVEQ